MDKYTNILELIANKESKARFKEFGYESEYDVPVGYNILTPEKPLTQMTIAEVKKFQKQLVEATKGKLKGLSKDEGSGAVGKFQVIGQTLNDAQNRMGFKDSDIFSKEMQDSIAKDFLLARRGYDDFLKGELSMDEFQNNLAKEWASIPTTEGESYYSGQPAFSVEELRSVLQTEYDTYNNIENTLVDAKSPGWSDPNKPVSKPEDIAATDPSLGSTRTVGKTPTAQNKSEKLDAFLKSHAASNYKDLDDFLSKNKKLNGGGDIFKDLNFEHLSGATKGLADIISLSSDFIKDANVTSNAIDLRRNVNPFFKDGGDLSTENLKTAVGPSHESGGIPVDAKGNKVSNPKFAVAEIEGDEKIAKFNNLPDLKGKVYIFPKDMKKSLDKIDKKYEETSNIDQMTKEFELKLKREENELKKKAKAETFLKKGGDLPKYFNGGNPFAENSVEKTIAQLDLSASRNVQPLPAVDTKSGILPVPERKIKEPISPSTATVDEINPSSNPLENIKALANLKGAFGSLAAGLGMGDNKPFLNKNNADVEGLVKRNLNADTTEAQREIIAGLNSAISNLRKSTRSQGVLNANVSNAIQQSAGNRAKQELIEDQLLQQNRLQASNVLFRTGESDSQKLFRAQQLDDQDRAALYNQIGQGFDNIISTNKLDNNIQVAKKQSIEMLKMLADKYPNFDPSSLIEELINAGTFESIEQVKEKVPNAIKYT